MIKTIILSMCLAVSSLSLNARADDAPVYTDGPVTEVDYIHVEYGRFDQRLVSLQEPGIRLARRVLVRSREMEGETLDPPAELAVESRRRPNSL